jgi:uncharacterized protein
MPDIDFRALQRDFAAHLRDPGHAPAPPGIEERRLRIYRRLFINNIEDLLARGFPVLVQLLGRDRWSVLVRDFYREHGCRTPYFHRLADEFVDYLGQGRSRRAGDFPFMAELAHYERVELLVAQDPADDGADGSDPAGDPVRDVPVLAPAARLLAYEYPVHRIGPAFLPEAPGDMPTYLIVFRDRDLQTGFIELNPLSARILWYVEHDPAPGAVLIARVAADFALDLSDALAESAEQLLWHWLVRGVLVGTRPAEPAAESDGGH